MQRVMGIITANYTSDDLGALTENRTIASLPFGGRYRLIDFPLSNMVNAGIQTVGLVMPYKYRSIIDHVGAGKEWGLDRKNGGLFILPGSVFGVNTVHHRFLIRDLRRNEAFLKRSPRPFVLLTAASLVNNMDYEKLLERHLESGADITMAVKTADRDNDDLKHLELKDGRVTGIRPGVHPGDNAFLDCFIVNHKTLLEILDWYEAVSYMDLFDAISRDLDKFHIATYEFTGYTCQIHSKDSFFRASQELLNADVRRELFDPDRPITTKIMDAVPTTYGPKAKVENALIPAGCEIRGKVKNSVLFRGVVIEEGAKVENSIIMQNCTIRKDARIENAIVDRYNEIGEGTVVKGTKKDIFVMDKYNKW